jgi:transcriptional regulator with XRE-family HTH domain
MEVFDSKVLRKLIEASGLDKTKIAAGASISRTTLNDILGGSIPKITTLMGLARILNTTVAELIGEQIREVKEIHTITIDTTNEELIVTVPAKARAGYLKGYNDPEYIENLPITILPEKKFKATTTRGFEISGDSMEPTFRDKDTIYGTFVEQSEWKGSVGTGKKEDRVYILVTTDGIIIKRLMNIPEAECFICTSDNAKYRPFKLQYKSITEIWEARRRLTADFGRKKDSTNVPYIDEFGPMQESEND